MMVDIQKLKGKMVEKGYTQDALASRLGIDRSTLNRKLKRSENFLIWEANRLVEILGLSREEATAIFFASIVA